MVLLSGLRPDSISRFWSRVEIGAPDECWLWTGPTNHSGFGYFSAQRGQWYAHRVAWELTHGVYPPGHIGHTCRKIICCNPAHLFIKP